MKISWITKHFTQLSSSELYAILQLRSKVFVVEQKCIFNDIDNNDQNAYHIIGTYANDTNIFAYSRIFASGLLYPNCQSIGRVVCPANCRGYGIGRILLGKSIMECDRIFGKGPIKIGAQYRLLRFYESFGFIPIGDKYEEDGIDHICMIRDPLQKIDINKSI